MFKILVVEDDKNASKLMNVILKREGYDVVLASNGAVALDIMYSQYIDLIVLDVMMPEMDGYEFTEALRKDNRTTPILMVTAKEMVEDKIKGFKVGIDDYMVKPVNEEEMLWRIKALLRRYKIATEQKLCIGDIVLDYNSLSVTKNGITQTVPKKEFYLLFKLLSYPGQIFTRIQLMDEIWGMESNSVITTVNVHINKLRKKFGDWPEFDIVAIKGIGYKAVINRAE